MTEERKTRKQLREEAEARKPQHVDPAKLRAKFDSIIHDIDEVLKDE